MPLVEKLRAMFSRKRCFERSGRRSSEADMALSVDGAPTSPSFEIKQRVRRIMKSLDPAPQLGVEMESRIWSRLSPELVFNILAYLPVSSLARFRCVCKEWQITLSSPVFLKSTSNLELPWLFICTTYNVNSRLPCYAYNPTFNKWHTFPLTFLPYPTEFLLTGVGGLLLGRSVESKVCLLSVCNPVTGSWRELPRMHRKRVKPMVGILEEPNSTSSSFKILVAGGTDDTEVRGEAGRLGYYFNVHHGSTEVYDSATDSWTVTGALPEGDRAVKMTDWVWTSTSKTSAFCCNTLYCLTSEEYRRVIMAYSFEQGSWSELKVPKPYRCLPLFLLERQDRLLLVAGVGGDRIRCEEVVLWELQMDCQQWVEVSRMPQWIFLNFQAKDLSDLECAGDKHTMYFIKKNWLHNLLGFCDSDSGGCVHLQVVVCDLSRTPVCWRWLPCCPVSPCAGSLFYKISCPLLVPRLDAYVPVIK